MGDLAVDLYGIHIGDLRGDWRSFDFHASTDGIAAFGLDSPILSVAAPLALAPSRGHKSRRQGVFGELLPEGRMLSRLAQEVGVPAHDSIAMLRAYGRDIAGALQIWDPGDPGEPRAPSLEPLTVTGVGDLLRRVADFPLANRDRLGKTSLAGVQDKIVLARTESGWNRALDGFPSTHILKPISAAHPSRIANEEYGARLASSVGLSAHRTWLEEFDGVAALVIERYDRGPDYPQGRLHQEDFNQALGARGDQKYQRMGGRVSLAAIAQVLTRWRMQEERRTLLRMLTLALAVGNLDLHAKNLSLMHPPDSPGMLAPAYDVVPMAHEDNDGELALAVDGEFRHAAVTREHLIAEAESWGVRDAGEIVDSVAEQVRDVARRETPTEGADGCVQEDIVRFSTNLLDGLPLGTAT